MLRQRYQSLDVFRGATVATMILVNNPGTWSHVFDPLEHASWHGLTPTDLVFPFFLFVVGNAMAFVMPQLRTEGDAAFWKKILMRTFIIFLTGTFLNWFPFVHWVDGGLALRGWEWLRPDGQPGGIRISGTLQRIALCYFFASIIVYYTRVRTAAIIGAVVLIFYWIICILANPADPYSFEGWFGKSIDLSVFGEAHVYRGDGVPFENEGIISTLPAIFSVVFGFIVGDYIRRKNLEWSTAEKVDRASPLYHTLVQLFIAAAVILFVGYLWSLVFPVNKKIQSSSFILITTGLAITLLSVFIYLIEVKHEKGKWVDFFTVFGKNPLFIYALSELVPRISRLIRIPDGTVDGRPVYTNPLTWFYEHVCALLPGPPEIGSLFYAICIVTMYWMIGYWMSKRGVFVRV